MQVHLYKQREPMARSPGGRLIIDDSSTAQMYIRWTRWSLVRGDVLACRHDRAVPLPRLKVVPQFRDGPHVGRVSGRGSRRRTARASRSSRTRTKGDPCNRNGHCCDEASTGHWNLHLVLL